MIKCQERESDIRVRERRYPIIDEERGVKVNDAIVLPGETLSSKAELKGEIKLSVGKKRRGIVSIA